MNGLAVAGIAVLIAVPPVGVTVTGALISTTATATATGAPCGGPAQDIVGVPLDAEQLANAAAIIAATDQRHRPALPGLPARAAVTAVATALQESGLRNLPYGDRDSLGLFQQRASWGPARTSPGVPWTPNSSPTPQPSAPPPNSGTCPPCLPGPP